MLIAFEHVDPALPGALRWKIARHEYSSYDSELRNGKPTDVYQRYALAGMQYAAKTHDKGLANAVMQWAHTKRLV